MEDLVGSQTLATLEKADKYLDLSAKELSRHLRGKVLELGAGNGNLTERLAFKHPITALDINPEYLKKLDQKIRQRQSALKEKFSPFQTVQADLYQQPSENLKKKFDTILSCQVLEHLKDDEQVLKNYAECLSVGGKLVLQLPAMSFAFSDLDKNLGHHRRYSRTSAEALVEKAGFTVVKTYYFNFIGLLGWLWAGKIMKKQILPAKELSIFNILSPFLLKFDLLFSKVMGLNVIVVAEKQ